MALVENIDPIGKFEDKLATETGAGMLGYKAPGSSVLRTVKGVLDIQTYAWTWGAVGDGVTDDAPALNAAIQYLKNQGGGQLILSKGIYGLKAPLNLLGAFVTITGTGIAGTQLKAITGWSGTSVVDLYEAADARISPVTVTGMTINANALAANCVRIQYRHMLRFEDCLMTGAGSAALFAVNAWLGQYYNCNFEGSTFGVQLDGSNHRTAFYACSLQGCTNRLLIIRTLGAAADGNGSLLFSNCDFEFSASHACDIQCTQCTFHECYVGENMGGVTFLVQGGHVSVQGGQLFFGYTAGSSLFSMQGGSLVARNAVVNGQTFASISTIGVSTGGKFRMEDCPTFIPVGGVTSFPGDALLFKQGVTFAPRLGVDYVGYGINATITDVVSGNARTVTAVTTPGPNSIIGMRANLDSMRWRDGEKWAVVCTYSSNVDINVRVANGPAGAGTFIGSLPATGGAVKTGVLYGTNAVRTTATVIEVFRDTVVAPGHTFTVYDLSFGDSRQVGAEVGGTFSNLCKF